MEYDTDSVSVYSNGTTISQHFSHDCSFSFSKCTIASTDSGFSECFFRQRSFTDMEDDETDEYNLKEFLYEQEAILQRRVLLEEEDKVYDFREECQLLGNLPLGQKRCSIKVEKRNQTRLKILSPITYSDLLIQQAVAKADEFNRECQLLGKLPLGHQSDRCLVGNTKIVHSTKDLEEIEKADIQFREECKLFGKLPLGRKKCQSTSKKKAKKRLRILSPITSSDDVIRQAVALAEGRYEDYEFLQEMFVLGSIYLLDNINERLHAKVKKQARRLRDLCPLTTFSGDIKERALGSGGEHHYPQHAAFVKETLLLGAIELGITINHQKDRTLEEELQVLGDINVDAINSDSASRKLSSRNESNMGKEEIFHREASILGSMEISFGTQKASMSNMDTTDEVKAETVTKKRSIVLPDINEKSKVVGSSQSDCSSFNHDYCQGMSYFSPSKYNSFEIEAIQTLERRPMLIMQDAELVLDDEDFSSLGETWYKKVIQNTSNVVVESLSNIWDCFSSCCSQ